MTVKELIVELAKVDPDLEVVVNGLEVRYVEVKTLYPTRNPLCSVNRTVFWPTRMAGTEGQVVVEVD